MEWKSKIFKKRKKEVKMKEKTTPDYFNKIRKPIAPPTKVFTSKPLKKKFNINEEVESYE